MPLYEPQPLPQFNTLEDVALYVKEEFDRLAALLALGNFQSIRLDQLNEFSDLPRPRDGDLAYWTASAVGTGQQGLYEWDSLTTSWKKL